MEMPKKNVSIMCFHDELCQVFNAMMTALSLLRQGAKVTVYFGSRGVNAIHKDKVGALKCLPDMPEVGEAVTNMDQATQQNAALVEEMAAAASEMLAAAERLRKVVAGFRL